MKNSCSTVSTKSNYPLIFIRKPRHFVTVNDKRDMFYENDFKVSRNTLKTNIIGFGKDEHGNNDKNEPKGRSLQNDFLFITTSKNKEVKQISQHSLATAAKPLILFASLFGAKIIRYNKNDIAKSKWLNKLYSLLVITSYLTLNLTVRPSSWHETRTDYPLNILTKTYGMLNIMEAMYSIFITTFCNTEDFVRLFKKLDEIDNHFWISETVFIRRRFISVIFIIMPIFLLQTTLWIRKFYIQNVGAHLTFFLVILQGAMVCYIILNIFIKLLNLNKILRARVRLTISNEKDLIFRDTIGDSIVNILSKEPSIIQSNNLKYSWLELMQMYDKLADCIQLFNKIYCGQVFMMFNSWLLCTLLLICRSFSPSIKYSEVVFSDFFLYSCINSRPVFLAVICEMFIRGRKKTLLMLLHVLLIPGKEHAYFNQVETMIMLVVSRKLEISANVFTANIPTVMNFAGRIISYTVLIIQYFYKHVFKLD